jgi:hypothetical protein
LWFSRALFCQFSPWLKCLAFSSAFISSVFTSEGLVSLYFFRSSGVPLSSSHQDH